MSTGIIVRIGDIYYVLKLSSLKLEKTFCNSLEMKKMMMTSHGAESLNSLGIMKLLIYLLSII